MVRILGQTSQSLSAALDADQLQRAALGRGRWEMLAVAERLIGSKCLGCRARNGVQVEK